MAVLDDFLKLRAFVANVEKRSLVYGAHFSEFVILRAIAAHGSDGIRRVDLAERVGLSVSGVTRALAPLEKGGYVDTLDEAQDARVRKVRLSEAGAQLYGDIASDVERRMDEIAPDMAELLAGIH